MLVRLCNEVVVGRITCGRIVLGQDAKVAEVRRVLVTHMEDEGDQENEKEDEREGGKQRVKGRVVESQNSHIMSA